MRETPVEELGLKLPSVLLPLWDSEMGTGFIATFRSLLGADVMFGTFFCRTLSAQKWVHESTIRRERAESVSSSSRHS